MAEQVYLNSDYFSIQFKKEVRSYDGFLEILAKGAGMNELQLNRLQQQASDPHGSSPLGIGLLDVFRRLELHFKEGYPVEVDSLLGSGTLISIRLPILR